MSGRTMEIERFTVWDAVNLMRFCEEPRIADESDNGFRKMSDSKIGTAAEDLLKVFRRERTFVSTIISKRHK